MSDAKIEPWITAAAEHIHKLRMGSLEVQFKMGLGATHPDLSNTEQSQLAQQLTVDAIARVLATHAPAQDQAIGPGDVVQVETPYTPERHKSGYMVGNYMFSKAEYLTVGSVFKDSFMLHPWEQCDDPIPLSHVVRIGRAKYWPDGSVVEGGK